MKKGKPFVQNFINIILIEKKTIKQNNSILIITN